MFLIIWKYEVRPNHVTDFEKAYEHDGAWAKLFARSEGFLGVQLLRGSEGGYLTIDHWRTEADFLNFKDKFRKEYLDLDLETEGWTDKETCVGTFHTLKQQAPSP